jgi:transposase-like protein
VRREHLTPKNEFEHDVKRDVEARVREGVKAIFEEVLEEEMTQHLKAGYGSSPQPGEESATDTTQGTFLRKRER